MNKSNRKQIIIPPYWVDILIAILALLAGYAFRLAPQFMDITESSRRVHEVNFIIYMGQVLLLRSFVHYSLHDKGIVVRFLGIPIRRINWDQISHAEYIYHWNTGAKFGKINGQGIFVTLHGSPVFVPEIDGLNLFILKHPIRSFFIRFTPKHQKMYVSSFTAFYSKLAFQLGYEENLQK